MRAKPIYSVRDALGRELWWTMRRRHALELGEQLNEIGPGAYVNHRGGPRPIASYAFDDMDAEPRVLHTDTLPVAVWKCSPAKPK